MASVGFLRAVVECASRRPGPTDPLLPPEGRGLKLWSPMPNPPNGTPAKKPPAPSLKLRLAERHWSKDQAVSRLSQPCSVGRLRLKLVSAPNRFRGVAVSDRGAYDAVLARPAEGIKPRWRHIVNPSNATIRKRAGSSSPQRAAATMSVAMSSRTASGWLAQ